MYHCFTNMPSALALEWDHNLLLLHNGISYYFWLIFHTIFGTPWVWICQFISQWHFIWSDKNIVFAYILSHLERWRCSMHVGFCSSFVYFFAVNIILPNLYVSMTELRYIMDKTDKSSVWRRMYWPSCTRWGFGHANGAFHARICSRDLQTA